MHTCTHTCTPPCVLLLGACPSELHYFDRQYTKFEEYIKQHGEVGLKKAFEGYLAKWGPQQRKNGWYMTEVSPV